MNLYIVTGTSRGIGPYIARALAREGMHLVLAARSGVELERVAAEITATGAHAIAVIRDLLDSADVQGRTRQWIEALALIRI